MGETRLPYAPEMISIFQASDQSKSFHFKHNIEPQKKAMLQIHKSKKPQGRNLEHGFYAPGSRYFKAKALWTLGTSSLLKCANKKWKKTDKKIGDKGQGPLTQSFFFVIKILGRIVRGLVLLMVSDISPSFGVPDREGFSTSMVKFRSSWPEAKELCRKVSKMHGFKK